MSITLRDIEGFVAAHSPRTIEPTGLTRAAVLFPFIERDGSLEILLTERTDLVEHHKGQVSFPGGMMDRQDASSTATALREAEEEIGLASASVRVLGHFDDLRTPTGFLITPVIAVVESLPVLTLNPAEVEAAFFAPVSLFFDSAAERRETRVWKGEEQEVYAYDWDNHRIWGITAYIIRSFLYAVRVYSKRT